MEFIDSFMLPLNEILVQYNVLLRLSVLTIILMFGGWLIYKIAERKETKFVKDIQAQGQKQMLNHFIKQLN